MAKESPNKKNGNLSVSLKAYFEYRLENVKEYIDLNVQALRDAIVIQHKSHDSALDLATRNLELRLDKLNELREAVTEKDIKFATKDELFSRVERLDNEIRGLRESRATLEGKASQTSVIVAYLLGSAGLILGLIQIISK